MAYKTIKAKLYDSIWNDIINGVYELDHVFNEKALVEKYGVSKSPVRDALLELCKENILRSIPRYGYEIVKIPEKQLREIIDLRILIECDNLRKACSTLQPGHISILKKYNIKNEEIINSQEENVLKHWIYNMDFHKKLYSFSNNKFGMTLLENCLNVTTMAYSQFYKFSLMNDGKFTIDSHKEIVSLLENEKYEDAVNALQRDIEFIKEYH